MYKKYLFAFISLCTVCSVMLCSCNSSQTKASDTSAHSDSKASASDTQASLSPEAVPLPEGVDLGQEYIDAFVFLGESTTSHLKNRGVLSGGTNTKQVWSTKSGTLMLDSATAECQIVYPESGEELDLGAAMANKQPKYMLLTFGLNGAAGNVRRGASYFKGCYGELIDTLQAASPQTVIILNSCFPVAASMDMSNHSVSVEELNSYIDILNNWTSQLAAERGLGYLNSAEVLKDADGFLFEKYQAGDGYHLTKEAYIEILKYIRTHPYTSQEVSI